MSKADEIITVKLGKLKLNNELLRMRPTNQVFVGRYRHKYRTGVVMPMIIVRRVGRQYEVVSGYHRLAAMRGEFGPDYEVEVTLREYADWQNVLAEVVTENESHGNMLTGYSRRQLAHALLQAGMLPEKLGELFGVPMRAIEKWENQTVRPTSGEYKGEQMPVKRNIYNAGITSMSGKDYEESHQKDLAINVVQLADQLTRHITKGQVLHDEDNKLALVRLYEALEVLMDEWR